jgi:hypothetical protein
MGKTVRSFLKPQQTHNCGQNVEFLNVGPAGTRIG